ncbi:zinc finger CCHC domain-containing protein 10-like [Ylistrum balloti]|uniref:zinc finger CCHC domain-containing protein 10-like n=1 Tax=Ylistrum balloti TaxID=509963 RepID=UPI002905ADEC|nr:zinc finger CCHC domain-containing protein 10-like [Ylistrum balloti]
MIRVKNVPLSAEDGQIKRAISLFGCEIIKMYRERLRVDSFLTNCETGDRLLTVKDLKSPIPSVIEIGKYRATVKHKGQPNENATCSNCLEKGHYAKECTKEKVFRECKLPGHIKSECPKLWVDQDQYGDADDEDCKTEDDMCSTDSSSTGNDQEDDDAYTSTTADAPDNKEIFVEASESKSRSRKRKESKTAKNKEGKKDTQTMLDKFMKNTPSRKSSQLSADLRSPPEDIGQTAKKKCEKKKD